MYLWHNFKCLCDIQVEMLNMQLDICVWRSEGVCALNINLEVVLACSILAAEKSKRPRASTYTHGVLFGSKSPYGEKQNIRVPIKYGCKESNLLIGSQQ